jgi:three-Cys-motif partner protein
VPGEAFRNAIAGGADATMKLDTVGRWTEVKLTILREYSAAYAKILSNQNTIRHYAYIDGFAGSGYHISKISGYVIEGSPAMAFKCGFSHCHLVDLDGEKTEHLQQLAEGPNDVTVYTGDCSEVLPRDATTRLSRLVR